jgi:RNA polymerase sigma-70 factor (ECF subfamily)
MRKGRPKGSGSGDTDETNLLLGLSGAEERQRLFADLFTRHRDRLKCMVRLRLDTRVRSRVDPSDVIQEAYLEASRRLEEFLRAPSMPFFLWVRRVTGQKLMELHRFHLGIQKRAAGREVSLDRDVFPHTTSQALAAELLAKGPSPSGATAQTELRARLEEALNQMHATDREIVALRHFEQLSNAEAAEVLGIGESAARKRYLRAMKRLKDILSAMPCGWEES